MSETPQKEGAGGQDERDNVSQEQTSARRELIQRYAKVAVGAVTSSFVRIKGARDSQ
ncbi:hypothetical protein [Alloacidobacterium sp.]|uniref:hypothetical protein n=1 Tax=Alloacidobacterium sp. TaxID=2951999 RepID=UPI002D76D2F7|nr:hypothetical protein [Alloacidobacterium sp.]